MWVDSNCCTKLLPALGAVVVGARANPGGGSGRVNALAVMAGRPWGILAWTLATLGSGWNETCTQKSQYSLFHPPSPFGDGT